MAMFRKLFYRKPPDGLLEISERLYVFDCCFTTEGWEAENYKVYVGGIIGQLRDHFPDASLLVFNFREEETQSQMAVTLSDYDMTIMDYPRQYEGCPLLTMEVIHHFLRSSESWLSLGPQNVLLMHCERGGWPVLAFMLAALLIYRKQYSGEHRTLEMVYKQAPHELLQLLSPLNPLPSQLRYLQYVSRRNVASEWPPLDRALTLDCIILRLIPNFGEEGGCRPIFRVYGQDPFLVADRTPKVLYSTPKRSKTVRLYKQAECELVKIDINSHIQGDVVLECISLNDDLEREEMMFRAMFNTAFIRSNILILNRDEIDTLWNVKDQFPKEFRAEVLFSEMDAAASIVPADLSCFEEKEGLPIEAFAKVQEIFSHVDWLDPKTDAALNVLHQLTASNIVYEKLDTYSHQSAETMPFPQELSTEKLWEKQKPTELEINPKSPAEFGNNSKCPTAVQNLPVSPLNLTAGEIARENKVHLQYEQVVLQPPSQSEEICQQTPQSSQSNPVFCNSVQSTPVSVPRCHSAPSAFGIFPLEQEDASSRSVEVTHSRISLDVPPLTPDISCIPASSEQNSISISPPTPPSPPPLQPFASACSAQTLPSPPPPPPPHFSASKLTHPSVAKNPETYLEGRGQPSLAGFQTAPGPISPGKTFNESSYDSPLHALDSNPSPPKRQLPPNPPPPPMITPPRLTTLWTPPPPPTPPLKEHPATRAGPPPPPPPPLRTVQAAGPAISSLGPPPPPTPPLKERPAIRSGPPPPPPPPLRIVQAEDPAISSLGPPPPPPAPTLKPASQNSTRVPSAPPPSRGPSFSSPSTAKGRGLSRTISPRNHQIKKLKPLHWLKLTRAAQGSLWAEAQKSGEASKAPEIDMSELESLFSATVTNSGHGSSGGKSNLRATKSDIVQLIDHRRAYNCEIMLSKVKVPLHDLMSSVLALEDSALDVDQVDNLIKFCPTKEEMELLKGYSGQKEKLGKCEQFFLELMQVPRVESKLRVFSFKIQFRSQLSDLRTGLNVVNSAAEEMRTSVKLKRIMQTILSLGNALNQGTARGSAIGFRLDSLLKLTDTRAKNNKMTLMHYLCKVVADKLPELLDFSKDLASLEAASRIQLKYLAEEMQAVSKGLEKVVQELSLSENDGPISENFRKTLKEFLSFAEAEVRSLALLYSGVGKHVDALILYFGEDPSRCPFEQVVSTLQNFVRMFKQAHEENCKQLELEKKKAEKESNIEKLKIAASTGSGHLLHTPVK